MRIFDIFILHACGRFLQRAAPKIEFRIAKLNLKYRKIRHEEHKCVQWQKKAGPGDHLVPVMHV